MSEEGEVEIGRDMGAEGKEAEEEEKEEEEGKRRRTMQRSFMACS